MKKHTPKHWLKSVGLVAGLTFSSWSLAAGSLTVSSPQDPGSWDPIDTFLVNWASVATNLYDGLTYRGPDLQLKPGLATSWEQLDDGKRIRFHLRENVTFHHPAPSFLAQPRRNSPPNRPRHSDYARDPRYQPA
ncbi:hypothetical protein K6U40_13550, partial [Vibrio fluvialis]|uniref:ABC transporter substrate-binding protein n=1 Tax=Vibrio fluvialis TaxID=676 RepID=UPI0030C81AD9|nr:hypothetical protein [Vibrio fluvialis]